MTDIVASSNQEALGAAEVEQPVENTNHLNKFAMLKTFIFRLAITYFIFNLFRRNPTPQSQSPGASNQNVLRSPATNVFARGDLMDVFIYLTETEVMEDFNDTSRLCWHLPTIPYGDWMAGDSGDGIYSNSIKIKASESLLNNGSMYIHVYAVKPGFSPDPANENLYSSQFTAFNSKMITRYKRRRISNTLNLLTGKRDLDLANVSQTNDYIPPSTHWHPNITINIVDDQTNWVIGSIPPPINEHIQFYEKTNQYYPVIYLNDYWNLNEDYKPVNSTTPELELHLTVAPMSLFKWQLYLAQTMRKNWYTSFISESEHGGDDDEQDTLKKTIIGTNPYLLALTIIVSIVHSIFEILAFKNDIQFWKSRESFEGLSVRSVFLNIFYNLVIVLYVFDNETNFVVKLSVVCALFIDIWKVKKVVQIKFNYDEKIFGIFPTPHFEWQSSYIASDTKVYDKLAFQYLSWVLFPLLFAYAAYSLIYETHRGWYSWILSMLYGFFLTFGFIAMTPQLFINYKMKSVAHLPWRMLTYKALNTFIDDLFAFVIHMPTLYRVGCLRDDIIFFIYLYQRWIYPMDPKRLNEFGVSQEMLQGLKKDENVDETSEPAPLPIETAENGEIRKRVTSISPGESISCTL